MELRSVFGLPAHPLFVHGAVVLLPLAALGTILGAVWPRARRHLAVPVLVLSVVAVIAVQLASGSGEQLEGQLDETELIEDHTAMGDTVLFFALATMIGAGGVGVLDLHRRRERDAPAGGVRIAGRTVTPRGRRALGVAVVSVALVTSTAAIVQTVRVGHSGAKATWNDVGDDDGAAR